MNFGEIVVPKIRTDQKTNKTKNKTKKYSHIAHLSANLILLHILRKTIRFASFADIIAPARYTIKLLYVFESMFRSLFCIIMYYYTIKSTSNTSAHTHMVCPHSTQSAAQRIALKLSERFHGVFNGVGVNLSTTANGGNTPMTVWWWLWRFMMLRMHRLIANHCITNQFWKDIFKWNEMW